LPDEVVNETGDASENFRISDRATAGAAKGGDADLHVVLAVPNNQGTAAVTLNIKLII